MNIGIRIRQARNSKNLSLDELARITGLTGAYIGRLERGDDDHCNPTVETLKKLARALDTTISELIGESKLEVVNE